MKFIYATVFAALLGITAGTANANMMFDVYVGAGAGLGQQVTIANEDIYRHSAQSYAALVGLDIPLVRIELEYDYMAIGDDSTQFAFADAYLKLPMPIIRPYIGAGAGLMFAGTIYGADVNKTVNAYQGMLGLSISTVILPITVDIEGRAIYIPDAVSFADQSPDVLNYEGRIKLRYKF